MKEILERYGRGDSVDNDELYMLYNFYFNLESSLKLLGPTYRLAYNPIARELEQIKSYMIARGMSIK